MNTSVACLRNRDGTSSCAKLLVRYKCCHAVQQSGEKDNANFVSFSSDTCCIERCNVVRRGRVRVLAMGYFAKSIRQHQSHLSFFFLSFHSFLHFFPFFPSFSFFLSFFLVAKWSLISDLHHQKQLSRKL